MRKIFITPAAQADVTEIWNYLYEKDERAAANTKSEFEKAFELLLEHPFIGRERPEVAPPLRSLAVNPYVVFYQLTPTLVVISRVLHGARDLSSLFPPESVEED